MNMPEFNPLSPPNAKVFFPVFHVFSAQMTPFKFLMLKYFFLLWNKSFLNLNLKFKIVMFNLWGSSFPTQNLLLKFVLKCFAQISLYQDLQFWHLFTLGSIDLIDCLVIWKPGQLYIYQQLPISEVCNILLLYLILILIQWGSD